MFSGGASYPMFFRADTPFLIGMFSFSIGFFLVLLGVIAGSAQVIADRITLHPKIAERFAEQEKAAREAMLQAAKKQSRSADKRITYY